jgi:hypothetical protein
MTEAQDTTFSATYPECLCGNIRKAFRQAADAFLPPESAAKHFRQARVEVWRGIRELIDRRIEHLSRDQSNGTRVVVE